MCFYYFIKFNLSYIFFVAWWGVFSLFDYCKGGGRGVATQKRLGNTQKCVVKILTITLTLTYVVQVNIQVNKFTTIFGCN